MRRNGDGSQRCQMQCETCDTSLFYEESYVGCCDFRQALTEHRVRMESLSVISRRGVWGCGPSASL
jgi:hypothetical protein